MSLRARIRKRLSGHFSLDARLDMAEGGALGILGASGSGKSMTLKCIAGIETPDEGRIELNGRVLFDSASGVNMRPQERRVGYLFQNYALFPQMNALENVVCGLSSAPLRAAEKKTRAREFLARMGLAGCERQKPAALSGGQQQRVALARMLIAGPELILLDEPFSALDSGLREQMQLQFSRALAGQNLILVTHSRGEAYRLCDEIMVMDAGTSLIQAAPAALFADPKTVAAARITGCKNITAFRQTGEHEVFAIDWGLTLKLAAPVRSGATHIGIRARDITAASRGGVNTLRPRLTRISRAPFETTCLCANADAEAASAQKEIWWKTARQTLADEDAASLPQWLFFPPERLLQLRGTEP